MVVDHTPGGFLIGDHVGYDRMPIDTLTIVNYRSCDVFTSYVRYGKPVAVF